MKKREKEISLARLEGFAVAMRVDPPKILVDADGGPSKDLLDFASEHSLSLDWIVDGAGYPRRARKLADIHGDLLDLAGLQLGLMAITEYQMPGNEMSGAAMALNDILAPMAKRIADDLETVL